MGEALKTTDWAEVDDEKLEAHVRGRITPELVEWMRRKGEGIPSPLSAMTDATFGAIVGSTNTLRELHEEFQRLLTEQQDPEAS